jgi:hypothetical protein
MPATVIDLQSSPQSTFSSSKQREKRYVSANQQQKYKVGTLARCKQKPLANKKNLPRNHLKQLFGGP